MLSLEPKRPGHPTASGIDLLNLRPRNRAQRGERGYRADHGFLVAVTVQEYAGAPSISTRQAPHCSLPQPYFTLEQPISSCKARK